MNRAHWQNDIKHALATAEELGHECEIIVLGHSLGGALVSFEAIMGDKKIVSKMILLAPANGLKPLSSRFGLNPVKNSEFLPFAKT